MMAGKTRTLAVEPISVSPGWRPRNVLARMNRAGQNTPTNYPAARHAAMIAEALMTGGRDLVDDEPKHCGVSIGVTVELFWKVLRENEVLRIKLRRRAAKGGGA